MRTRIREAVIFLIALVCLQSAVPHTLASPQTANASSEFALKPNHEPAAIRRHVAESKGVKKHWVNLFHDEYTITFMTEFLASSMDDAMRRGCAVICQKATSDLKADGVPVHMVIMRSSDGYIVGAY